MLPPLSYIWCIWFLTLLSTVISRKNLHPVHLPTDAESNQTCGKLLERQAQITILQDKIAHVKARFEADYEEAVAKLRPTMDALHNQIPSIQQQMASLWSLPLPLVHK
jgi:hypothetical protein